ncbi:MAG: site-specific integrase [Trueperaceae bacterium]|nr:site-specific integrase [Trueperaceae bacterium]
MTNAIQKAGGTLALRARGWATLSDEELKRRAATAANERDPDELWSLVEAHMATKTRAGTRTSRHTLRNYRRGVLDLLEAWQGENLLRPSRNAADLYVAALADRKSASGEAFYKPGTIRLKIAAARALYRALRWTSATTARPFEDVELPADPTAAWDKRQPYTHDEVVRMLAKADETDTAIILLGAHAGLRVQ